MFGVFPGKDERIYIPHQKEEENGTSIILDLECNHMRITARQAIGKIAYPLANK